MPHTYYWTVYSNGIGGWFAWHAQDARRVELVPVGTYADALAKLSALHECGRI